jgi:hypothetical protein
VGKGARALAELGAVGTEDRHLATVEMQQPAGSVHDVVMAIAQQDEVRK